MNISGKTISIFNVSILLMSFVMLFVFFPKKTLNYDEPYQIMCSKGITFMNIDKFANKTVITSAEFNKEDNFRNVFFGGTDSIHYVLLHYFISFFGNDLNNYVLFSVIWSILTLIFFYVLCRDLFGNSLLNGLAIALLATHIVFQSQAYSIRHYMMALFFVVLSGIYYFRYMLRDNGTRNLVLLFTFCILSFLSHYLTSYIIAAYIITILIKEKEKFFTGRNMLITCVVLGILLLYYTIHSNPLDSIKNNQNYISNYFKITKIPSLFDILSLFMKNMALNFNLVFVLFKDLFLVRLCSFIIIAAMFFAGLKMLILEKGSPLTYKILLFLAICSSLFSGLLAYFTNNIAYFTHRYNLFSVPFCVLFICFFFKYLFEYKQIHKVVKYGLLAVFIVPVATEFVLSHKHEHPGPPCNHLLVINEIVKNHVHKIELPKIADAVFINSMLPVNYQMDYYLDSASSQAVLFSSNNAVSERIPLINNDLIVLF